MFLRTMVVAALLAAACPALAQVRARGQIFLPTGQAIGRIVQFDVESDDSRRQTETYSTDSQGRFWLQGLTQGAAYRIVVRSDGQTYATTVYRFLVMAEPWIAVHLLPLPAEKPKPGPPVSVAELGRADSRGREAYEKAAAALRAGKTGEAKKQLRRALELDPQHVPALNELAVLSLEDKDYKEAEKLLRRGLQQEPAEQRLLYNLGRVLNFQQRYAEAVGPLRGALKAQPQWTNAEAQLGIALLETDQPGAARPCLERGTQAQGADQVFAYLYLGKWHALQGTFAEAVFAWEQYLKLDANSPNAARIQTTLEQIRPQAVGQVSEIKASGACQ